MPVSMFRSARNFCKSSRRSLRMSMHVVDRRGPLARRRRFNQSGQPLFVVTGGDFTAVALKGVQTLRTCDWCPGSAALISLKRTLSSGKFVVVFALARPVGSEHPEPLGHLGVVGRDAPTVAEHRQVFRREKTRNTPKCPCSRRFSFVFAPWACARPRHPRTMFGRDVAISPDRYPRGVREEWTGMMPTVRGVMAAST